MSLQRLRSHGDARSPNHTEANSSKLLGTDLPADLLANVSLEEEAAEVQRSKIMSLLVHRREVSERIMDYYHALNDPVKETELATSHHHHGHRRRAHYPAAQASPPEAQTWVGLHVIPNQRRFLAMWHILLILIDATYTAFWVPVAAAFELNHRLGSTPGTFDFVVGIILCLDIALRFVSPIVLASTYKQVKLTRPSVIGRFYVLKGTFVIDILAAVPLVFVPLLSEVNNTARIAVLILRILRLARVQRVINMIFYVQMLSVTGASGWRMTMGSVLSMFYTIAIITNFLACFWYWVGTRSDVGERGWLAQEYKMNGPGVLQSRCDQYIDGLIEDGRSEDADAFDCEGTSAIWFTASNPVLWTMSLYYIIVTLTTVGYGDITPSTTAEVWVSIIIMICGLAVFASILGNLVEIVASASKQARKNTVVRNKLTDVQRWLAYRNLDTKTRGEVLRFYAEDWGPVMEECDDFLTELPTDIASLAIWNMVQADFKQVPLWTELEMSHDDIDPHTKTLTVEEAQKMVASKMSPEATTRGTHVAKQGSQADCIFFLQRGEVEVLHMGRVVSRLVAPTVFGEASLLRDKLQAAQSRMSGYRTSASSMIWRLPVDELNTLNNVIRNLPDKLNLGLKKTIYDKLYALPHTKLQLIKIFLRVLNGRDSELQVKKVDKLMPGLVRSVDMALVQVLAFYDKQAFNAKMGMVETPGTGGWRKATMAFVPHAVQEEPSGFGSSTAGSAMGQKTPRTAVLNAAAPQEAEPEEEEATLQQDADVQEAAALVDHIDEKVAEEKAEDEALHTSSSPPLPESTSVVPASAGASPKKGAADAAGQQPQELSFANQLKVRTQKSTDAKRDSLNFTTPAEANSALMKELAVPLGTPVHLPSVSVALGQRLAAMSGTELLNMVIEEVEKEEKGSSVGADEVHVTKV